MIFPEVLSFTIPCGYIRRIEQILTAIYPVSSMTKTREIEIEKG